MGIDYSGGHEAHDYDEHRNTYDLFIKGTIYLTVIVVLILIGMALFLV